MGLFSRAKDNYDKRRDIAEFNYKAKEYIQEGQTAYESAYTDLVIACDEVQGKISDFVRYKQKKLDEINKSLKKLDSEHKDMNLALSIDFPSWERCGISVQPWEKLTAFDKIIDTWTAPSVRDFVVDVSASEYYEAKSAMNQARSYKTMMKAKKQELRNARSAIKEIPYFMNDEKSKIEALMGKFYKTVDAIKKSPDADKVDSLKKISELIAESLTTQFLDNNYNVTSQYKAVHDRMGSLNQSLGELDWLIG